MRDPVQLLIDERDQLFISLQIALAPIEQQPGYFLGCVSLTVHVLRRDLGVEFTTIPLAAKPNCSKPAALATKSNLFSFVMGPFGKNSRVSGSRNQRIRRRLVSCRSRSIRNKREGEQTRSRLSDSFERHLKNGTQSVELEKQRRWHS